MNIQSTCNSDISVAVYFIKGTAYSTRSNFTLVSIFKFVAIRCIFIKLFFNNLAVIGKKKKRISLLVLSIQDEGI